MHSRHFTTIADTTLRAIEFAAGEFILVTDNDGQNGMVYERGARIGPTPHDTVPYAQFDDGVIWRHGQDMGRATVGDPVPDSALEGYRELKRNPTAIFRYLKDNN